MTIHVNLVQAVASWGSFPAGLRWARGGCLKVTWGQSRHCFPDLSKAFENVQHEQLLLHLQKSNIGGTVLKCFSNYLKGRFQKVLLPGHVSEEFICSKRVPQGNVLGPLLFKIYVLDLHPIANMYNVSLPSVLGRPWKVLAAMFLQHWLPSPRS